MSQPTTRQWAEWVKEAADNGWTPARLTVPLLRNLQAKLEALADAEDARPEQPAEVVCGNTTSQRCRPEQPEAMGPVEVPRPPEGTVILIDGIRYCVGRSAGVNLSTIHKLTSYGTFETDGTLAIYWPHASYSRVEACEGRE